MEIDDLKIYPHVGMVALAGRANVGKSSLVNTLVGEKVTIVSPVAQTTRNTIRAIYTEDRGQLVFLDTPGIHRIGGVADHVHLFTHIHPTVSLAALIKTLKLASGAFIRSENLFPQFDGWQNNYAAFTLNAAGKDALIEYIKNQEQHHATRSFKDELQALLEHHQIAYDPTYLD